MSAAQLRVDTRRFGVDWTEISRRCEIQSDCCESVDATAPPLETCGAVFPGTLYVTLTDFPTAQMWSVNPGVLPSGIGVFSSNQFGNGFQNQTYQIKTGIGYEGWVLPQVDRTFLLPTTAVGSPIPFVPRPAKHVGSFASGGTTWKVYISIQLMPGFVFVSGTPIGCLILWAWTWMESVPNVLGQVFNASDSLIVDASGGDHVSSIFTTPAFSVWRLPYWGNQYVPIPPVLPLSYVIPVGQPRAGARLEIHT